MREDLVERLNKSDVTFDIMAKLFVDEQKTPIEDGAVRWRESDSPPFRIAQLVLPQQDLGNSEAQDAEARIQQIGFNPWNGAETFRPLGQLNRGRQMASRRLNSDRFFTVDFTSEVYTPVGFKWVADNNMRSVLLRHYPKLEAALRGSKNAFAPWNRLDA